MCALTRVPKVGSRKQPSPERWGGGLTFSLVEITLLKDSVMSGRAKSRFLILLVAKTCLKEQE